MTAPASGRDAGISVTFKQQDAPVMAQGALYTMGMKTILLLAITSLAFAMDVPAQALIDQWKEEDLAVSKERMAVIWKHFQSMKREPIPLMANPKTREEVNRNNRIKNYNMALAELEAQSKKNTGINWSATVATLVIVQKIGQDLGQ